MNSFFFFFFFFFFFLIKQRDDYEQLKQKLDKTNREMNTVKERFNRQANELEDKLSKTFKFILRLRC